MPIQKARPRKYDASPQEKYEIWGIRLVEIVDKSTTSTPRCLPVQPKVFVPLEFEVFLHNIKKPSHRAKEKNLREAMHTNKQTKSNNH